MGNSVSNTKNNIPLCVDLDGTLIASDTLLESMLIALKINPFILFLFPFWILNGRAHFKAQIAKITFPDPASLPYHQDFMNYVLTEYKSGREIVLATATLQPIADRIAEHLGIFSKVLASTPDHNLRDEKKRKALVDLYGEKGFDYAGDSSADLSVWPSANLAIIVHPKNGVLTKAKQINSNNLVFNKKRNLLKSIIKQIRVYQWIKNILLFMPILMAHRFADFGGLIDAGLAFFSFSFTASFVYVLNDLLDLESDRKHPRKRFRPLAAGDISIPLGIALIPLLLIGGIAIALVVNLQFLMILMIDNYDSFTYNIVQYLGELGSEISIYRNDKITISEIEKINPEKIIISPGPCTPNEAGISVDVIKQFYKSIPILGVCLGHQSIGQAFGGEVVKAKKIMHGKVSMIEHDELNIFNGIENPFQATRYHSLVISKNSLPKMLEITASTNINEDNEIMAVRHREYPVFGIQFHPESILTNVGKDILANFLKL